MGLLSSQHGGNTREAAALYGVDEAELLDFSANINPLGMPGSLRQAIVDNLALAERYPDVEYQALHARLAAHHRIPLSWVLAGNGETELIFALAAWLAPRRALLVTPGFAEYRRALQKVGCDIIDYPLTEANGWQIDEAFFEALTPDLDCLFLCTPNNPTGLLPDDALIKAIVKRCGERGITLIVDEAFLDFVPQAPGLIPVLAECPHVWVLRSLTKFFAIPGLRLGYLACADEQAVAALRARREPWSINAFAALAGEVLFADSEYLAATFAWLNRERPWLYAELAKLAGITVWPGAANYLFLRCDAPGLDLQAALLAKRILIRSCANYPGLDARYYRVAVKSREANAALIAALKQVLAG
ncbi:threonine-phosphate decarboxylase [Franconibacter daqui]|uniref:threonine-phosphate decarboxylase CobD n=1 Tax=Franconibacter daqui TaxID=2047724 RepID=UPI001667D70B|nr:threonine-phosphate decarboxylase CobD [Franconibacter daqui]GGD23456.1 threonine-phosphate decarboxylase [Franconibacter daqui]